jgi:CheY-like chemotaxis protein
MTKRVLDVGNCRYDHASIRTLLQNHFGVEVWQADGEDDTLTALQDDAWDLVLVNRVLDRDHTSGIDLIRKIKADKRGADIPIMLITNFEEHQQAAMDAGALRGFGKKGLSDPGTLQRLGGVLDEANIDSPDAGRSG